MAAQSAPQKAATLLKSALATPSWLGVKPAASLHARRLLAEFLRQVGENDEAKNSLRDLGTGESPHEASYERLMAAVTLARIDSDTAALEALQPTQTAQLSPAQRLDLELARLNGLGALAEHTDGGLPKAIGHYRTAKALALSSLGAQHPEVGRLELQLGAALARGEDLALAEAPLRQAISILETADVSRPLPELATALVALADIYEELGSKTEQEIEELRQRAARVRDLSAHSPATSGGSVDQPPPTGRGHHGACACTAAGGEATPWRSWLWAIAVLGASLHKTPEAERAIQSKPSTDFRQAEHGFHRAEHRRAG